MRSNQQHISRLLKRYMDGDASEAETAELFILLDTDVDDPALGNLLNQEWEKLNAEEGLAYFPAEVSAGMLGRIKGHDRAAVPVRRIDHLRRWSWVAAAVLLILATGGYFLLRQTETASPALVKKEPLNDALPGRNGAILTLADGSSIVLDSLPGGEIAQQAGARVVLQNGQLAYTPEEENVTASAYNVMTTPRGRQFAVTLRDGTKVWLNAASSLRYPTVFSRTERKVEVTGEAYFEVAKDKTRPFRVKINNTTEVEVLGTHFNINAYADEASINTTLLEGSVRVNSGGGSQLLRPGEQARVKGRSINLVKNADAQQAIAWKNGLFSFTDADLPTVMRQISRWYDVDVVYAGAVPKGVFTGEIDNYLTLDQLLDGLTRTVNYRIENGNKLIILPE